MHSPQTVTPVTQYPYLDVDYFIGDFLGTQCLGLALKCGLIDCLSEQDHVVLADLCKRLNAKPADMKTLLDLLMIYGAVIRDADDYSLTARFRTVLPFRDLIEAKLEMANRIAPDLIRHFRSFIFDMDTYMRESGLFELFDYGRCYEITEENLERTRTWVHYTSTLSRYEAEPFLDHIELDGIGSVLDIGGNNGEFAVRLCAAQPELHATVFDLPAVCVLGREHTGYSRQARRIRFIEGDLQHDDLPGGHNLHIFKSFLHDWPEEQAINYLQKSRSALPAGGRIVIFERSAAPVTAGVAYANLPLYLFARFYRDSGRYTGMLDSAGFTDIQVKKIQLDSPFMLVSAKKKSV